MFWIRIHHFKLNTDPDPAFWWPKIEKYLQLGKMWFFLSNTAISLSLGFHKGRPSYRRSLQPSKGNIQHFKTWNFWIFFYFVGHFCTPGSGSTDPIESGSNPNPDLKHWRYVRHIWVPYSHPHEMDVDCGYLNCSYLCTSISPVHKDHLWHTDQDGSNATVKGWPLRFESDMK